MNEIEALAEEFSSCRKMLIALGDENRCHLILEMMKMGECRGVCRRDNGKDKFVASCGVPSSENPEGCRHYQNAP